MLTTQRLIYGRVKVFGFVTNPLFGGFVPRPLFDPFLGLIQN